MIVNFQQLYNEHDKPSDQTKIVYPVFLFWTQLIFFEYDIKHPMQAIFDIPMPTRNNCEQFCDWLDAA